MTTVRGIWVIFLIYSASSGNLKDGWADKLYLTLENIRKQFEMIIINLNIKNVKGNETFAQVSH